MNVFSENRCRRNRPPGPGLASRRLQRPGRQAEQLEDLVAQACVCGKSPCLYATFTISPGRDFRQPRPESFWDSWPPSPAEEPGRSPLLRGAVFLAGHERKDYNSPFSAGGLSQAGTQRNPRREPSSFSSRPANRRILTGSDETWGSRGTRSLRRTPWAACALSAEAAAGAEGGGRASSDGCRVTEAGLGRDPPVAAPGSLPPSYLSSAGRGAGPRLYRVFPAASGWCCVILWLRVVCGTLSVGASAGSGKVKPRPEPVASDGSGRQHPLALGDRGGR
ncbi:uncharacterized protein LOC102899591 [Felis catus]|uniref:uncharacterized protein LOC102899591 n=1 Tax=Felis catus TaxID=9685 RepID=UPI000C2FC7AE|nr:uncharacterized protein LOC102899591 [Felis catus]